MSPSIARCNKVPRAPVEKRRCQGLRAKGSEEEIRRCGRGIGGIEWCICGTTTGVPPCVFSFRALPNCPTDPLGSRASFPPLPFASLAVDLPPPADTIHAPSPFTDSTPALERSVGELVAQVAAALAAGLREKFQRGKVTSSTTSRGGNLIMRLYILRRLMIADWPFDDIAREHGAAVLRETCGNEVTRETVEELVEAVVDVLRKVSRAVAN